jgi:methylthioribose-1-phosphate isomerase
MSDQDVKAASRSVSFFEERTVRWNRANGSIRMIDQSILPLELRFVDCNNVEETVEAIKSLKIRGAPAIGVCGAMGAAIAVRKSDVRTKRELLRDIEPDCIALKSARPTAINLAWGVEQVLKFIRSSVPENLVGVDYKEKVVDFVEKLADEDVATNKKLSELGSRLFKNGDGVLTHCN